MQRNTSQSVQLGSTSARRSEQTRLERSTIDCRKHPHKTTKTRGSYLPEPKILRIQQRYINGQNKSEIAREEKCDRETVARIVQFPEMQNFIARAQQEFCGLIPDAMAAVRYALQVDKNPTIGLAVLERTGVSAQRGERMQLPETAPQDGYSRQAIMIANVLLEAHENMGVDLPKGVEEALAKDSQESMGVANTVGVNLPRLPDFSGNASRRRKVTSRN
jgi:hypothetical protein